MKNTDHDPRGAAIVPLLLALALALALAPTASGTGAGAGGPAPPATMLAPTLFR
jgi:hypothetical protein